MIDLTEIIRNLPVIALTVSILYYAMNLRNANKTQKHALETRQAQLFMQIFNQYTSLQLLESSLEIMAGWTWNDYSDFMQKYGPVNNPSEYSKLLKIINYFEGIGILLKRGLIDKDIINDLMGEPLKAVWIKFEPIIVGLREANKVSSYWSNFEFLAKEIMIIE
jgi:hypothetical protein